MSYGKTEEERTFVFSSTLSIYIFRREVGHSINVSTPCSINVHTQFVLLDIMQFECSHGSTVFLG